MSGGAWSVSAASLADGTYTARARQIDAAGNSGTSDAHTFTVAVPGPDVAVTQPSSGQLLSQSAVVVGGTASSDPGDASSVTVRVYSGSSASGLPVFSAEAAISLRHVADDDERARRRHLHGAGRARR